MFVYLVTCLFGGCWGQLRASYIVFSTQSYNATALCSQTQTEDLGYSIASVASLLGAYVCVGIDNRVGLTK